MGLIHADIELSNPRSGNVRPVKECEVRRPPLMELPPRSPQLNGIVERANRTVRDRVLEPVHGRTHLRRHERGVDTYLDYYNNRRPHRAIGMRHEIPR